MVENLRADGVCETTFRVRYADTDAMGVVHHSQYLVWFEEGRSAIMRELGVPYSQVEREGYWFTVAEVTVRYHTPARYDEKVTVATCITKLGSRGLTFDYEVKRAGDDVLLSTGTTRHICIDHQGRVRKIPLALRKQLAFPYRG